MKWRRLVAYGCILSGISVFTYSIASYTKQLFVNDPPTEEQKSLILSSSKKEYSRAHWTTYGPDERPKSGEQFAYLIIPNLDLQLPVYEGTDPVSLKKGVGHYTSSALPGEKNHVVLSAHRDSYFRELGSLKAGDKLGVKTEKGIFIYEITRHWITTPEDRSVITPTPQPLLTLTTCYPFTYLGNAPKRYIIQSILKRRVNLNF